MNLVLSATAMKPVLVLFALLIVFILIDEWLGCEKSRGPGDSSDEL